MPSGAASPGQGTAGPGAIGGLRGAIPAPPVIGGPLAAPGAANAPGAFGGTAAAAPSLPGMAQGARGAGAIGGLGGAQEGRGLGPGAQPSDLAGNRQGLAGMAGGGSKPTHGFGGGDPGSAFGKTPKAGPDQGGGLSAGVGASPSPRGTGAVGGGRGEGGGRSGSDGLLDQKLLGMKNENNRGGGSGSTDKPEKAGGVVTWANPGATVPGAGTPDKKPEGPIGGMPTQGGEKGKEEQKVGAGSVQPIGAGSPPPKPDSGAGGGGGSGGGKPDGGGDKPDGGSKPESAGGGDKPDGGGGKPDKAMSTAGEGGGGRAGGSGPGIAVSGGAVSSSRGAPGGFVGGGGSRPIGALTVPADATRGGPAAAPLGPGAISQPGRPTP